MTDYPTIPDEGKAKRRGTIMGLLAGAAAGAAAMFVLDPQSGRRRRSLIRDKAVKFRNTVDETVTDELPQRIDYLSGFATGAKHRVRKLVNGSDSRPENEQVLVDRVLSTVFRDPDLPKGDVNIDASGTTVFLRGSIDDPAAREEIEKRVRDVEGVDHVVNLINQPDADPSQLRVN